jgi:hypothetical protein
MPKVAFAQLRSFNNSNVSGLIRFIQSDDGQLLTAVGTATNMRPFAQYVSLVYGLKSNADVSFPLTPPGPCVDDGTLGLAIPDDQRGDLLFDPTAMQRMLLGSWRGSGLLGGVVGGQTRMLQVTKPTNPLVGTKLEEIKTVSIRQAMVPLLPDLTADLRPQAFVLVACGEIVPAPV